MRYSGLDDVIMEASSIAHFSEVIDWKAVTTMLRMRMQDHPLNELAMEIQDISPEFSKVIHDNFWDLVDTEEDRINVPRKAKTDTKTKEERKEEG